MMPPRVVIDTNCLVSALIFSRSRFAWLRHAWQTRRIIPLVSRDTAHELLRVLAYPKFKLTRQEQDALLAECLPYTEAVRVDQTPSGLPSIRNADDIIFLVVATVGSADALVSGDGHLLAVKDHFHIPILTPAQFEEWLQPH
jgi:putative PIN family toxin of toxin-antitoxin system